MGGGGRDDRWLKRCGLLSLGFYFSMQFGLPCKEIQLGSFRGEDIQAKDIKIVGKLHSTTAGE